MTSDESPHRAEEQATGSGITYLLVDGENIHLTLQGTILGRRPDDDHRTRWDAVKEYAKNLWGQPVKAAYFIASDDEHMPWPFVRALERIGYTVVPLDGDKATSVVDIGIIRTLDAIAAAPSGDVLLVSHDGDFVEPLGPIIEAGRRVGVLGFRECVKGDYARLGDGSVSIHDLEYDVGAFRVPLPRVRSIAVEDFDPTSLL